MAYIQTDIIDVICWDQKVGAIALDPSSGYYAFEYYSNYKKSKIELAPLTVPLREEAPVVFPYLPEQTYYRLPAFVADALPDNFGNSLINAWMANNGVSVSSITSLDRLAYMGSRGMGALEFKPSVREKQTRPSALEMKTLIDTARKAVHVNLNSMESFENSPELSQLISVGTSAGGARAKAVVGFNPNSGEFVSGQFDTSDEYEHWIIKFDIPSQEEGMKKRQYGRIEYAYYLMAEELGINIEKSRLFEVGGRAHFMTKRFDRDGNKKHHMQSLCAMAELDFNQRMTHDYSQLFDTAQSLGLGYEAMDELFLRMVFNVCMANNDDHSKNHAFLLKEGGTWELSPAFDLTYSYDPKNIWLAKHLMAVNGKFSDINREDMLTIGRKYKVASPHDIIDKVVKTSQKWPEFADKAGLSSSEANDIYDGIKECTKL